MALITSALLPHSPLLIPEIGQANYNFLQKTTEAYQKIANKLIANKIETLIIISPHGSDSTDLFSINVAPEMTINLQDFGFIPPKTTFAGDALLADQIQEILRLDYPRQLISQSIIDHGSAIPLYLLKDVNPQLKIIIISPASNLPLEKQLGFGKKIQTILLATEKNIGVIASGDLSHRLQKTSPAGYSPKGAKFDNKLIEYLSQPVSARDNILKMDHNLITDAQECGLKPLVVLLGILDGLDWDSQVLAYQTDFGIGYLSMDFEVKNHSH